MSELVQEKANRASIRRMLLAGGSALALAAYVSSNGIARAEDADQPQVWIELGGQLNRLQEGQQTFSPDFPNSPPRPSIFSPSQKFERTPLFSMDEYGQISLQPKNSNWVFSASIRYGRSDNKREVHQQTYPKSFITTVVGSPVANAPIAARFSDTSVKISQSHTILDFQAGKDVGLGLFGGHDASSIVSIGVRFAQFASKSNITLKSDPDWHRLYKYASYPSYGLIHKKLVKAQPYHSNAASLFATRNFHGVGPSISWNASAPFAGNSRDGEITIDWGLNAALLFGRQKAKTHHQTTGRYGYHSKYSPHGMAPITYQGPTSPDHIRSRGIIVPNLGGFAGLSFKYSAAKLSLGYRADFFFGAMDGGIDTRKSENVGFYGPFAAVSIGLP